MHTLATVLGAQGLTGSPTDDNAPPPAGPQSAPLVVPWVAGGRTRTCVLLAEDNIVNQKLAVRLLEKLGCQVDVAASGQEAVEMLALLSYDMVFMDCEMPELDGYAAAREIRRREGLSCHIPIIALTAHAMAGDRERCLGAGIDDYISKPVHTADLQEALVRWLPSMRPASPPAVEQTI